MRMKNFFLRLGILSLFSILLVCLIIFREGLDTNAQENKVFDELKVFTDALDYVQNNYVEDVEYKKLVYGAIEGMVRNLDPHSSFMTPELYKEMQVQTTGEFGGLGIEITKRKGILTVVAPIEDTPAYKAGMKAGDLIIEIEGEPTRDISLMEAVKKLRGPKGTEVTITIMREELDEPKEITIVRDIIKLRSVKSEYLKDGYGYIRITQFRENTSDELGKALDKITSASQDLKGVVLDLRNNPGGLLEQAVKVSDKFLGSGLIVSIKGKNVKQKKFYAKKGNTYSDFVMVTLVNGGSASASEIVAGALKDHRRSIIVGEPTFGKGSVQTIVPLRDKSALRLTTALYYTPNDHSIQAEGIAPDIVITRDELRFKPQETGKKRKRIRERDLKGHFEIEPEKEVPQKAEAGAKALRDPLVKRAVDLMKSWEVFQADTIP